MPVGRRVLEQLQHPSRFVFAEEGRKHLSDEASRRVGASSLLTLRTCASAFYDLYVSIRLITGRPRRGHSARTTLLGR